MNLELMQFLEKDEEPPLPPTSHANGILDEEVEDILSRWKDEEYEKRLAQGIPTPSSNTCTPTAPSPGMCVSVSELVCSYECHYECVVMQ